MASASILKEWVLARKSVIDSEMYQKLIADIKAQHFDISKIEMVPQQNTKINLNPIL